jgi:hypothetical protein
MPLIDHPVFSLTLIDELARFRVILDTQSLAGENPNGVLCPFAAREVTIFGVSWFSLGPPAS